mgnify:CR=1 FL=1
MDFRLEEIKLEDKIIEIKVPLNKNYKRCLYVNIDAAELIYLNLDDQFKEKYPFKIIDNIIYEQNNYISIRQHLDGYSGDEIDDLNIDFIQERVNTDEYKLSKEEILKIFEVEKYYFVLIGVM